MFQIRDLKVIPLTANSIIQCRPANMINHNILQYDKSARKRARRRRAFLNHQNDKIMINHYDKFNASTVGWNRVICPVHRALRSGCVFLFNSLRFTLCMHRFNVHIRFHGNFVQKPPLQKRCFSEPPK